MEQREDAVKWQKENMRSRFILPVVTPQKVFIITQLIRTVRSTAVDMHREDLDGSGLIHYPMLEKEQILWQNYKK